MGFQVKNRQEGVAAIEFALVITTLLLICFGIVSYGMLMWAQQKVSHIAGDSTRVALQQNLLGKNTFADDACNYARSMAQADGVLGQSKSITCQTRQDNCLSDPVGPVNDLSQCLWLKVTVQLDGLPLVELVQSMSSFFDTDGKGWVPTNLSATSIVKITEL